jgi:hypothetical protein
MQKTLLTLICSIFTSVASAQLCYTAAASPSTSTQPLAIAAGKIDNNQSQDLIVGSFGQVRILLNNGSGTFTTSQTLTIPNQVISISTGYFNNDSYLDFIAVNVGGNAMVALGSASGTFALNGIFPGCSLPQGSLTDDFNNDTYLDLIVADGCSPAFHRYLGASTGTFALASVSIVPNGSMSIGITSADFNADGNKDIVTCNNNSNNISFFAGDGTGGFIPPITYTCGSRPAAIVKSDFNKDGIMDVATANTQADSVAVLYGAGNGQFNAAQFYSVGDGPTALSISDFNGDGNIDLAVSNYTSNTISLLQYMGAGSFSLVQTFTNTPQASGICTADFNGDEVPDIACTARLSSEVDIYLSTFSIPGISGPNAVCENSAAGYTVVTQPGTSVLWSTGSTFNIIATTITNNTLVSVTANNGSGCAHTRTLSITSKAVPSLSVSASTTVLCKGESATLTAQGQTTYNWLPSGIGSVNIVKPNSNITYTAQSTGTNNCVGKATVSMSVNVCTSVSESRQNIELRVQPNPSNGKFNITYNGMTDGRVQIFDLTGKLIFDAEANNNVIDISTQPKGMYYLVLKSTNSKVATQKIIVY